jgi:dihydroceramidase
LQDYHVSPYVAEFWNTLSSLPIALFGLLGWIAAKKHAQAEMRFDLAFCGLFIVGLGSTAFHATMRRYAQVSEWTYNNHKDTHRSYLRAQPLTVNRS